MTAETAKRNLQMADEESEEKAAPGEPSDETPSSSATERSRRTRLTPEQRRFLGPARSLHDQSPAPETPVRSEQGAAAKIVQATSREHEPETARTPRTRWKLSRAVEMQNVALIFGALFLLGITFFFGKKYESLKYAFASRNEATLSPTDSNKFAGISAGDLVEQ